MNDEQDQKTSFRHFSTMPLWGKLALIAAIVVVGIITYSVAG